MNHDGNDKKKLVVPLVVLVVIACLVALIIYPVVSASPKDIPLAVLSLDEGAQTTQGEVNIGETIVEKISSMADENTPVTWTNLKSQSELDQALEAGDFYATLIIPEDFTSTSVAAQMGMGEQSKLRVIIDQGKNPAIADTVDSMLSQMFSQNNMSVEVEYVNPVSDDLGSGLVAQQMSYMLTIIISIVISIVLFMATRTAPQASKKERTVSLIIQVVYAALLALGIGWFVSFFMTSFAYIAVPFVETMLFVWLASFALMLLFLGFFNWHFALGAFAILTVIVCGLTTALLPYELLPEFWQNWFYPWVPQRFIAGGLGQVFYQGAGVWNSASMVLTGIGVGGAALMFLSLVLPQKGEAKQ